MKSVSFCKAECFQKTVRGDTKQSHIEKTRAAIKSSSRRTGKLGFKLRADAKKLANQETATDSLKK